MNCTVRNCTGFIFCMFPVIIFLLSSGCKCSMSLPHGAVSGSALCHSLLFMFIWVSSVLLQGRDIYLYNRYQGVGNFNEEIAT